MNTPILIIAFNRPDHLGKLLQSLSEVKPPFLFIACDGARPNNQDDIQNIAACKKLIEEINWECKKEYLYREVNLGCKEAVSSAITWFFSQVEMGIILEDDCIPNKSFFKFCSELLIKYKDTPEIMHIGGTYYLTAKEGKEESYYFSKIAHIWGWASWKRAWEMYDKNLDNYSSEKLRSFFEEYKLPVKSFLYWKNVLNKVRAGEINTWDYQWNFSIWMNGGFSIIPNKNLVTNIGFGSSGTHTHSESELANMPTLEMKTIVHPNQIVYNLGYDERSFKKWFSRKSISQKVLHFVRKRIQFQ